MRRRLNRKRKVSGARDSEESTKQGEVGNAHGD